MERVRKRSSQRKNGTMWENSQMAEKKVVCRVVVHGDIKSSRAPEGVNSISRYVGLLRQNRGQSAVDT